MQKLQKTHTRMYKPMVIWKWAPDTFEQKSTRNFTRYSLRCNCNSFQQFAISARRNAHTLREKKSPSHSQWLAEKKGFEENLNLWSSKWNWPDLCCCCCHVKEQIVPFHYQGNYGTNHFPITVFLLTTHHDLQHRREVVFSHASSPWIEREKSYSISQAAINTVVRIRIGHEFAERLQVPAEI